MNNAKVVHLGETRRLLAEWNEVRVAILAGRVAGFQAGVKTVNGEETIYLAGVYRQDPMLAVRGLFQAARDAKQIAEEAEEAPPVFRASQM